MDDSAKKLVSGLIIITLAITGYMYWWRALFGDSESSLTLMGILGLGLMFFLVQRLK